MSTTANQQSTGDKMQNGQTERLRIWTVFWLAIVGLVIAAAVLIVLVVLGTWTFNEASDIVAIVGIFTSVLGTIIGIIMGESIGSKDKAKAEERSGNAERRAEGEGAKGKALAQMNKNKAEAHKAKRANYAAFGLADLFDKEQADFDDIAGAAREWFG